MFKEILKYKTLNFKKGDYLFQQNSEANRLFFLDKGRIKLVRETSDGQPLVIHIAYARETFAEASLFANKYHCHAICDCPCTVLSFDKSTVLQYLQKHPNATMDLLKIHTQQVRDLRLLNEIKSINSAYNRVTTFFDSEVDENSEFHFSYSLKDMAQKLGLAHETFYRTLKILEQEGRISRKKHLIKIR
ncbi:Crp/Fnr family transcriptional regulator [Bathymodiolus septemdierum thioautotrophic gill symbiont]|uniref:CRP/FNR family transcriptional regulator, anaerobic regulatory protein n=1 Tax=endosymbiont of Bathymodiolus septemdierum str. Myojin knoll TaxID=1303921 RepID=A0A0P0UTC6_9GAMM|nr:Crp/Fnr family transcriptional regulator [Bathymodiolus septemdierum thioautotrophic gill symbiont]BAS68188.1 CRP/FNR family transcriptional regulator, anaerobic regulatory protein [endosymbiont of Bathymodiolus septemdierum str. Myojin knoll]